jgi:hypothetical protein
MGLKSLEKGGNIYGLDIGIWPLPGSDPDHRLCLAGIEGIRGDDLGGRA